MARFRRSRRKFKKFRKTKGSFKMRKIARKVFKRQWNKKVEKKVFIAGGFNAVPLWKGGGFLINPAPVF